MQAFAHTHTKAVKLMGCGFQFSVVHDDDQLAWNAINAGINEITRIEKMISSWDEDSQTSEIIRQAGIKPVKVDAELFGLIERSIKISNLTKGAFDITFASVGNIYNFDGGEYDLPSAEILASLKEKIDYHHLVLDPLNQTVFLKEQGVRIGFGAIGKGFAAMRAKQIMQKMGIENGLVNASGDLVCWGHQEDGQPWSIGISDPGQETSALATLTVDNGAIVTSGSYKKYFMSNGKRYAHILDPRTCQPTTGIKSVSIVCPDAELADALATSVFVLGVEQGLSLINKLKNIECLIITDNDSLLPSKNLEIHYIQ